MDRLHLPIGTPSPGRILGGGRDASFQPQKRLQNASTYSLEQLRFTHFICTTNVIARLSKPLSQSMPPEPHSTESEAEDQEEQLKEYSYKKLAHLRSIRLLKLQPARKRDQEIVCELIEKDLDDKRDPKFEYEALSWSWGTGPWNKKIKIHEADEAYVFKVAPSIVQALTALRQRRRVRVLWVDAICINQKEPTEKNHQVPMMSSIYGGAKKVCIWLGEDDVDSRIAIDFIKQEVLKLQGFDELCESQEATAKWRAMLNLMKRSWFSRRWVVQEIALANDAELHCGTKTISWKDFADAVQLFVEVESATHRLSEVMRMDPNFYHIPGWFEYVSALGASLLVEATGTLFRASNPSKDKRRQPLLSLEYLVSRLSVFEATQPRDTIYALLAIAKDTAPFAVTGEDVHASPVVPGGARSQLISWATRHQQARRYCVDYSQPYVEICKDFMNFAIRQAGRTDPTRALDILCRPWAPHPKSGKPFHGRRSFPFHDDNDEVMPSWIPQLSGAAHSMHKHPNGEFKMGRINADPLVGLPTPAPRNYAAAETTQLRQLRFKKRDKYYSMYVSGFVLNTVGKVEVASQSGNIPDKWVEAVGWLDIDQDPPEEFWRTLVADRGRHGRNPPTYYARACKESITKGLASGSLNTTELINEGRCSVVSEFFRRVQAVIWNRSLMRTKSGGLLGIVRRDVKEGDLVCILYGCSVPVILRQNTKTPETVARERQDDEKERQEKREAAAIHIQRAFRESKASREARKRKKSIPQLISPADSHAEISNPKQGTSIEGENRSGLGDFRRKEPKPTIKPKPRHVQDLMSPVSSNEPAIERDENFWYEFIGECYVHGMMDGDAIKYQNQNEIRARVFELR